MSIGVLLRNGLLDSESVPALVSERIYPRILPQKPVYKAITYQRISNSGTNGNTALRQSRWQLTCWAESDVEAHTLADAVKATLEGWSDTTQTPGIKMALIVNELDDYDSDAKVFKTIIDVMLTTTGD